MASSALANIASAVVEVSELLRAASIQSGNLKQRAARARVVGRAGVVLLSSHFERYIYAVNEEACVALNGCGAPGDKLPVRMRLEHSRVAFEALEEMSWDNRAEALTEFVKAEGWLWSSGATGSVDSSRLLAWMKSPSPDNLVRYYRYWNIDNIFVAITRTKLTRGRFILRVKELVEKRNNIAHGDFSAQATRLDVTRYSATVLDFCRRADRALGRAVGELGGVAAPW